MVFTTNSGDVHTGCDVLSSGYVLYLSLLLTAQFIMSFFLWCAHPLFETNTASGVRTGVVYTVFVKHGSDVDIVFHAYPWFIHMIQTAWALGDVCMIVGLVLGSKTTKPAYILIFLAEILRLAGCIGYMTAIRAKIEISFSDLHPYFYILFSMSILGVLLSWSLIWAKLIYPEYTCTYRSKDNRSEIVKSLSRRGIYIYPNENVRTSCCKRLVDFVKWDRSKLLHQSQSQNSCPPLENKDPTPAIKALIQNLWNGNIVGVGRDARGLTHSSIQVVDVQMIECPVAMERFKKRKEALLRKIGTIGPIESYRPKSKPIATTSLIGSRSEYSTLKERLDSRINETFLFHGTMPENISSITTHGFDVKKSRSSTCGKGLYFAESPVKADQYTGPRRTDRRTMILARVLLGNMMLTTSPDSMLASQTLPCSKCFKVKCSIHLQEDKLDSVVLEKDRGLFREFVLYDDSLVYPEFVITYLRVHYV